MFIYMCTCINTLHIYLCIVYRTYVYHMYYMLYKLLCNTCNRSFLYICIIYVLYVTCATVHRKLMSRDLIL